MKRITKNCMECGVCIEKCPKKAIKFEEDGLFNAAKIDEGKCIDCNLCTKTCPCNSVQKQNSPYIKVAKLIDKDNIEKSTSGGIFGELARYILDNEGIVYGASYTDDLYEVHHIRCDNKETLDKILKSKYVKSNLNNTYKLVEKDLKDNKIVLYSGTPCQIAGLKRYLKKEYSNLYTVDVICHGIPSPKIYKKYIKELEKKEGSKVTYIDFRYLNLENPDKNLLVKFENGKVMNEVLYDNPYGRAFLIGLINGACCNECQFNDFRNCSDITLGDAWGYKNENYPHKNSLIFLNNEHGKDLYSKIKNKLIEFDDYDIEKIMATNYPILHPTFNHYNTGKVNLKAKDIGKELWYWLDEKNGLVKDKKGVGILNFHYENYNYGANLVAYSLSEAIKSIGYNPYVIDFDPFPDLNAIDRHRTQALYKFRKKHLNMTPRFRDSSELSILNDYLDMYVVGSDQVWRKEITQKNLKTYFLDFAKDKNKIAYAASMGRDCFEGDEYETIKCSTLLSSFYNISVREDSGKDICYNDFNQKAEVVLDPTLLLNKDDYEKVIDEEYEENVDVAVYFVSDYEKNNILERERKTLSKLFPHKNIVNIKGEFKETLYGKKFMFNSISKWLDGIRKCEYVVTDSYHGLVFSLLFQKKVILIAKNSIAISRFQTLFSRLEGNLEKINYSSLQDVKNIDYTLNYEEINKNLNKYRDISMKFLKDNLGPSKIKKESQYNKNVDKVINQLIEENNELKSKNSELNQKYASVINSRSWKLTKPIRYVKRKLGDRNG